MRKSCKGGEKNPVTQTARIKMEKLQPGGEGFLPTAPYSQTSNTVSEDHAPSPGVSLLMSQKAKAKLWWGHPVPSPAISFFIFQQKEYLEARATAEKMAFLML